MKDLSILNINQLKTKIMKTKILILSFLRAVVFAQEITGSWSGELNVQECSYL
jgi:hypothetical protein